MRLVDLSLKRLCFLAVREHFSALSTSALLSLPVALIKDLLPSLNICQLDQLQPALNHRGISTISGWVGILQEVTTPKHEIDYYTEEEAKREIMARLFPLVFYGFRNGYTIKHEAHLKTPQFLQTAAKYIQQFLIISSFHQKFHSLVHDQRPLLDILEQSIKSICLNRADDLIQRNSPAVFYILHRLLDHGVTTEVIMNSNGPLVLSWVLYRRGSQYANPTLKSLEMSCGSHAVSACAEGDCSSSSSYIQSHDDVPPCNPPCKRPKLDSASASEQEAQTEMNCFFNPQLLCQTFAPCGGSLAGACSWGQIDSLELRDCTSDSLRVITLALPTFFCLRSLTINSFGIITIPEALAFARALKQLSDSSHSSISKLSISTLTNIEITETMLNACPQLTSLNMEIRSLGERSDSRPAVTNMSEFSLRKLTIRFSDVLTNQSFITSLLRHSPHLTFLHLASMKLPTGSSQSQLLTTIPESNPCLRTLILEDMKLCDCHPEILNLLRNCQLEELQFRDCRLLETCPHKEETLQQLVAALKKVPTLHKLSLPLNRIAKNVCVLAELFSRPSPSSVKQLDISSNFIQAAELLEFAERLRKCRPPHMLTLDLRYNPGDRDPNTWKTALDRLGLFSLLVKGWKSTDSMVDHVSNM
ncbi:leucine-rich repeat-containing protein 41 [Pholidichthys leucotaenia]